MTPRSNPKNFWEIPEALNTYRKANVGVVLVPTVIGGVNDGELGDIIKFGLGSARKWGRSPLHRRNSTSTIDRICL